MWGFSCEYLLGSLVAALALCKYSLAEWNSTDEPTNQTVSHCHFHGDQDNCTGRYTPRGGGNCLFYNEYDVSIMWLKTGGGEIKLF